MSDLVPIARWEACRFIVAHHRHHKPPQGFKFAIGIRADDGLVGVVTVGRPIAGHRLGGVGPIAEVTRLCTDGTPHVASRLLGAAWRAAKAMGYRRLVSYTLAEELGTCYRAAGWRRVADSKGGSWHSAARPRREPLADALGLPPKHPEGPKVRWEIP